jgi:hypothetical protein
MKCSATTWRGRLLLLVALMLPCGVASAESPSTLAVAPQVDVRHGGVLAESYGYHRQLAPSPSITPPEGAYRYGFPVESYRWGWFGAERYYPHVVWHRGYNRDCVRWGYRRGY